MRWESRYRARAGIENPLIKTCPQVVSTMDFRREGLGFSTGANERSLVGGQEPLVGKALDLVKPWSGPWRGRSRFDEVG